MLMKIHFLGTNGWFDSETGETPCILIDAKEAYVILDAGNALRKIDRHITDKSKPVLLLLSHFHLDHTFGLHVLPKFAFPQGMTILGQPGTKETLSRLLASPFTAPTGILDMRVDVADLKEGMNRIGAVDIEGRYLVHKDPCFGYSLTLEGKKVAYCTDTGMCDNYVKLARDADLLISECSWKERNQMPNWPHLAPDEAAEAARKARAKRLMLTHFDPVQYKSHGERMEAQRRARAVFPGTEVAKDDLDREL
jgi:ribonuclease BN (tRNA processing enzyme)